MKGSLVDRYRRWLAYEADSHAKTIASFATVPAARHDDPDYRTALMLLAHMAAARQLWLFRMGAGGVAPTEFFPERITLEQAKAQLARVQAAWNDYLARLTDAELARVFEYRSLEGEPFRNVVEDVLTQLFGHSWYHRGQIAAAIRRLGGKPAATDFIYWTREPIERAL